MEEQQKLVNKSLGIHVEEEQVAEQREVVAVEDKEQGSDGEEIT